MTDLTLDLLQILDAIDRRGSFAAAAEELGRVPSALSYTIQKYEERLGARIFEREGRRSVFTQAGRHLLDGGRQLLLAANTLSEEVHTLASGWESKIKIAVDSLMPVDQVMDVIALFVEQFPSIELDISEEVLGGAWEALIDDRVQLVVGAPEPKPSGHNIQTSPIGTLQRVFAVSANHPLASVRQPLVSVDIEPYPMVVVHDSSRSAIPRNTRVINDDMHFYVQTITQKLAAQKAGIGVGFLPSRIVEPYLQSGAMVVLEVDEVGLKDHLFLAWKAANRGPGVKALLKLFRETEFVI